MKIIKYLRAVYWPIYVILFFCLAGLYRNIYQISIFGFDYSGMATKVLLAMTVIYASQIILILMRERKVWVISLMQAAFCIYVYEDFTFLPVTALVKNILWVYFPEMDYGWVKFINTAAASAMLTLEILKTYILFALTQELPRGKKQKKSVKKA